ncbi:MAG: O-antigen ligase family protein [Pirellulales bacterium]
MKTAPNEPTKATAERQPPAWLLCAFAALVVATMLAPSESAALRGTHAALCIGWFAWFLTYAGLAASGAVSLPALNRPTSDVLTPPAQTWVFRILALGLNWSRRYELLLPLLAIWLTCGAWRHLHTGDARSMLNVYWQWIAWICAYFAARWLLRSPESIRGMAVVVLAVVIGQAGYGGYQRWVLLPEQERVYRLDPEGVLASQGIPTAPGNALRAAYEERIEGRAPTGAFLHPNSLACLLAVATSLLIGIAVSSWRTEAPRSWRRWRIVSTALLAALIALACLAATSSRGGLIASLLGMMLATCWPRSGWSGLGREWSTRRSVLTGAVLLLGVAASVAFLSSPRGQSAWRSLAVRGDYWRASWAMLVDFPLWGCGLGNFQDYYTSYRPAWASEVVADPHNAWLEVAATAGVPAAIVLAVFQFVGALRAALFPRLLVAINTSEHATHTAVEVRPTRQRPSVRPFLIGGLLGVPLVCLCTGLVLRMPPPMMFLTGLPLAITLTWGLRPWMDDGPISPMLLICPVLALLANLVISGGIAYGGIAVVLWVLLAMARNAEDPPPESQVQPATTAGDAAKRRQAQPSRPGQRTTGLLLAGLGAALLVAAHLTMFAPLQRSQTLLARAALASDLGEFAESARWCREATTADRWSAEAARRWCEAEWRLWSTARNSRGQEFPRDDLDQAIALAVARAPRSAALRAWLGNQFLAASRHSSPDEDRALRERALDEYREAVRLFSTSALAWAQLAYAESLQGYRQSSEEAIRRAYELDAQQILNIQRLAHHPLFDDPQPVEPAQATLERIQRESSRAMREEAPSGVTSNFD